jgi:hypothetical protein
MKATVNRVTMMAISDDMSGKSTSPFSARMTDQLDLKTLQLREKAFIRWAPVKNGGFL